MTRDTRGGLGLDAGVRHGLVPVRAPGVPEGPAA
ncbi:hypothetical protein M201_gp14 [Haloarcula californiae tailed virus 2]|uniref:Uncharacterized protein n=1 Tax=Haloarcula californiae tailed virus 2 TaxID=1273747 RepID=R4TA87_9CAUD|nr:hypothetical protein M201_gp14 [Haloarcula californiae tailed virus 2]AGM11855.1 hypothetical protein HCTV2_16 [Haloarcula californiae tailed virus 2]